jgi:hypothetical protein
VKSPSSWASSPSPGTATSPYQCHRFSDSEFGPDRAHCVELATYSSDILGRYNFKRRHCRKTVVPCSAGEIDNLLRQHRVTTVSGRNSLPSFGDLTLCLFICWLKRAGVPTTSKLAKYSPRNTKFVFDDKVGHIVRKAGVVTRGSAPSSTTQHPDPQQRPGNGAQLFL